MRTYTAHVQRNPIDPVRDIALVREGFNFWAFLFAWLWAFGNGFWLVGVLLLAAQVLAGWLIDLIVPSTGPVILADLGYHVIVGIVANDLRRWTLARRGFVMEAIVAERDQDSAERRFLDHDDDLALVMRS